MRSSALGVAAVLLLVASACGTSDQKASTDSTVPDDTTAAAGVKPCPNGDFDALYTGKSPFLKTGAGSPPGFYFWLTGPVAHLRIVSDPAAPFDPPPSTTPPSTRRNSTAPTAPYTSTYSGEITATGLLTGLVMAPDQSAGLVEIKANRLTFVLPGKAEPTGFDFRVACPVKSMHVNFMAPGPGTGREVTVDGIFVGANGHPLTNPFELDRKPDPAATVTTTTAKPKAKPAAPSGTGAPESSTTTAAP